MDNLQFKLQYLLILVQEKIKIKTFSNKLILLKDSHRLCHWQESWKDPASPLFLQKAVWTRQRKPDKGIIQNSKAVTVGKLGIWKLVDIQSEKYTQWKIPRTRNSGITLNTKLDCKVSEASEFQSFLHKLK